MANPTPAQLKAAQATILAAKKADEAAKKAKEQAAKIKAAAALKDKEVKAAQATLKKHGIKK